MWADALAAALSAILTSVFVWLLFRNGARPARVENGVAVLRHGWGVTVLGIVCVGLGVLMVSGPFLDSAGADPPWVWLMVAGVGAAFLVAGFWFIAAGRLEEVRMSADGLEGRSGWSRSFTGVRWSDVERVRFSRFFGTLTFYGSNGRRVRISALLRGADGLADVVGRRLAVPGAASAVRQFNDYRGVYGLS